MSIEAFSTPIPSGLEPCDENSRLPPDVAREVDERCRALDRARAVALVEAQSYVITGRRNA